MFELFIDLRNEDKYKDAPHAGVLTTILNMYIQQSSVNEQPSYKPETPLEWAEQALLQANSTPTKAIAELELLRGVTFRPDRDSINLFISSNCEAALAYSHGKVIRGLNAY